MKSINGRGWLPVWLLTMGHFLSDFYHNFLPSLLPVVMPKLEMSLTTGGLLVMVFAFTSSILQPFVGYYIDKKGCTWLLLVTLPVSGVFICFAGQASSSWQLFLCIILAGLASAIFHPLASALLARVSVSDKKGACMSFFIGGGNVGVAASPALVTFFILSFGVGSLPWLILPAIAVTLAYYLYGMHRLPLTAKTTAAPAGGSAWYKSANLLKLNLVMGLRAWPQSAIPSFLIVWLTQQGHSTALAGSLVTTFFLGGAFGSVAGGYAGDKFGRKKCVISALLLCMPTLYVFLTYGKINIIAYLLLGIAGAFLQGVLPSSMVWAQEMLPANAAMASGMMLGLSFGLGGVGAAVTGAMADAIGLQQALLWTIAPLAVAAAITVMIPENIKKAVAGTDPDRKKAAT